MNVLKRLRGSFKKAEIDALLVSEPANSTYLSGIREVDGYLLAQTEHLTFFTDGRFTTELKRTVSSRVRIEEIKGDFLSTLRAYVRKEQIRRLGFEAKKVSVATFKKLQAAFLSCPGVVLLETEDIIERLRQVKSPAEVALIRSAVSLTQECLGYAQDLLASHEFSEHSLAIEIDRFFRLKAEGSSFSCIVAFDEYSAEPHHKPAKDKKIWKKVALIDLGVQYRNYCSDLTRVFLKDRITPVRRSFELKKIYDIVKKAKDLAIKKIAVGTNFSEIDRTARAYIESKGYGRYFSHSLGHGVGIQVHELPSVSSKSDGIVQENMVFTIEPAIYLPGRFGVRLEDMVWVRNNGAEVINPDNAAK